METLRMYCESKMTNNQVGDSKGARQSHLLCSVCAPLKSAIYAAVTPTCLLPLHRGLLHWYLWSELHQSLS